MMDQRVLNISAISWQGESAIIVPSRNSDGAPGQARTPSAVFSRSRTACTSIGIDDDAQIADAMRTSGAVCLLRRSSGPPHVRVQVIVKVLPVRS
mmetsp:Transcript_37674/g.84261  ORF Transcript_37674/g.84261 Transcript_37674/m.84261 type:complete len:95 (-) Transcript_37674:140-424(-)